MKNARDWYLTDWFICTPGRQVLERVVESPFITYQPTADISKTNFQIHAGTYTFIIAIPAWSQEVTVTFNLSLNARNFVVFW
jgi:hypothetical protein